MAMINRFLSELVFVLLDERPHDTQMRETMLCHFAQVPQKRGLTGFG